jgi:hypothetical protein
MFWPEFASPASGLDGERAAERSSQRVGPSGGAAGAAPGPFGPILAGFIGGKKEPEIPRVDPHTDPIGYVRSEAKRAARGVDDNGKRLAELFQKRAQEEVDRVRAEATSVPDPSAFAEEDRNPVALWNMAKRFHQGAGISHSLEKKQGLGRARLLEMAELAAGQVDQSGEQRAAELGATLERAEDPVRSARKEASGIQSQAIRAISELTAKHGELLAALEDIKAGNEDEEVTALKEREAREAEEAWKAQNKAVHLADAMDAWLLDPDEVYGALRGRTAEEMDAIRRAYKDRTGRDLDNDLAERLYKDEMLVAAAFLTASDPEAAAVQEAVARLRNAERMYGIRAPDAAEMSAAIKGLSPEQKQAVADAFFEQTGKPLCEYIGELDEDEAEELNTAFAGVDFTWDKYDPDKPPPLLPGENPPDPLEAKRLAAELRASMASRISDDEDRFFDTLTGRSPAMLHAIRREFDAGYAHTGMSLPEHVSANMSGQDLKTARHLLNGDPVLAAVSRIENAASGCGTKEKVIHDTLARIKEPSVREQVVREYFKHTGERLVEDMINGEMTGMDRDLARVLARANGEGDSEAEAKAKAIEIEMEVNGGFVKDLSNGIADRLSLDRDTVEIGLSVIPLIRSGAGDLDTGKANVEGLFAALEKIEDPKVLEQYEKYTGRSRVELEKLLERRLIHDRLIMKEPMKRLAAVAALNGDRDGCDAALIVDAKESWLGDEKKLIEQFYKKRTDEEDRAKLSAAIDAVG